MSATNRFERLRYILYKQKATIEGEGWIKKRCSRYNSRKTVPPVYRIIDRH